MARPSETGSQAAPEAPEGHRPSGFDPARMEIITLRDVIRATPERFIKQYAYLGDGVCQWSGRSYSAVVEELRGLDLETATAADLNRIIGNYSWARLDCEQCDREVERLLRIGEAPDYEARWQDICLPCLEAATKILRDSDGSPNGGDEGSVHDSAAIAPTHPQTPRQGAGE